MRGRTYGAGDWDGKGFSGDTTDGWKPGGRRAFGAGGDLLHTSSCRLFG
jgi:hypothetical protein